MDSGSAGRTGRIQLVQEPPTVRYAAARRPRRRSAATVRAAKHPMCTSGAGGAALASVPTARARRGELGSFRPAGRPAGLGDRDVKEGYRRGDGATAWTAGRPDAGRPKS